MPLPYDAALALYRTGRFAEIVDVAFTSVGAACALSVEYRLLLAEALLEVGETNAAQSIAAATNLPHATVETRARCELILGLVASRDADGVRAMRHLHVSARIARDSGDIRLLARSQLFLFRYLIQRSRDAEVITLLVDARRLVMKAGDPHLTALLHISVAIMEGQTGRRDEARRHAALASSILEQYPHAGLEVAVHTVRFCLAWFEGRFEDAAQHVRSAKEAHRIMAGDRRDPVLEVNQGHLDLMTGNWPAALSIFQRVLAGKPSHAQLPAADGLARLYLALNQLGECEALVQEGIRAATAVGLDVYQYYPLRWSNECAARLAFRRGQWDRAISESDIYMKAARDLKDRPLTVALLLLRADAQGLRGSFDECSRSLLEASEAGATSIRDQVAGFYDTCGRVLSASGSPLSSQYSSRAVRIWREQGNVWAQAVGLPLSMGSSHVRKYAQRDLDEARASTLHRAPSPPRASLGASEVLTSVVAAFELAHEPRLVVAELQEIADAVDCASTVRIRTIRQPHNALGAESHRMTLHTEQGGAVEVTCDPTSDVGKTLLAANIIALARNIDELARARGAERNRAALWPANESEDDDQLFISEETSSLASIARRVAPTNVPVLITGETGTGKEVLARAIHAASTRAAATFLPFNCAGGPRDMIDAQLFGHRRGAFTGAIDHAPGVIRAAAGGTLFLDEVGEAPLDVQPKLLRFLESGEIHPIGEPRPVHADVRVIAATNVDLDAAVSSGRFREDLFYRLNIVRLHLPPLRERRVEIPVFAQHYLQRHARELAKGNLRLAEETMEYLLLYRWPGNVRQLANEMRRLAALAETDAVLMPEHLSPDIVASRRTVPASERTLDANEVVVRLDQPLAAATEHLERAMLLYALKQCRGRMEETARQLGLSRKGLYLKRVRFGLEPPEAQPRPA